jgi:hypothetical protein
MVCSEAGTAGSWLSSGLRSAAYYLWNVSFADVLAALREKCLRCFAHSCWLKLWFHMLADQLAKLLHRQKFRIVS